MKIAEKDFHKSRIAFMIIDGEIMFLKDSTMSHIEWYQSLNYNLEKFQFIIRGYYREGDIVFYKGEFTYDEEVIATAKKYGNVIKEYVGDKDANIYVGVTVGNPGELWPPTKKIEMEE